MNKQIVRCLFLLILFVAHMVYRGMSMITNFIHWIILPSLLTSVIWYMWLVIDEASFYFWSDMMDGHVVLEYVDWRFTCITSLVWGVCIWMHCLGLQGPTLHTLNYHLCLPYVATAALCKTFLIKMKDNDGILNKPKLYSQLKKYYQSREWEK